MPLLLLLIVSVVTISTCRKYILRRYEAVNKFRTSDFLLSGLTRQHHRESLPVVHIIPF